MVVVVVVVVAVVIEIASSVAASSVAKILGLPQVFLLKVRFFDKNTSKTHMFVKGFAVPRPPAEKLHEKNGILKN